MMKNLQLSVRVGVQRRGDNVKYTYRTVNDKQVVFKITAEENISIDDFDTFGDLDNRFTKDLSDKLSKLPQNEYLKVIDTCLYYL